MPSALITVMSNAAIKASKGLLRDFGEVDQLQISRKGTSNFVTKSDVRTEKMLVAELQKARPDHGFLLEEGGEIKGKDASQRWIIDPLDGTSNFIHALPYFCISIALEKTTGANKEIIAGVIYDPIHNELFTAEKGKGAFLNDRKVIVSSRDALEDAMLVTGNPRYAASHDDAFNRLRSASAKVACVRSTGATALDLAYVAAGRFDGCWFGHAQPWDVAAGMLMIREAGGILTDFSGGACTHLNGPLVGANRHLHESVLNLLK